MVRNNIYIVGFMGAGKSTIGKLLEQRLAYKYIDLDAQIEKKAGCSIAEIFLKKGEVFFRELETKALEELTSESGYIVATGGGIVERSPNKELLRDKKVIFLDVAFETIYDRIQGDGSRPLAKSYEQLLALYERRLPMYLEVASDVVGCDGLEVNHVVDEVVKKMEVLDENSSD